MIGVATNDLIQDFLVTKNAAVVLASPECFIDFDDLVQRKVVQYHELLFSLVVPDHKLAGRTCRHQGRLDDFYQLDGLRCVLYELGHAVLPLFVKQFHDLEFLHARCIKDVQKLVERSSQKRCFKGLSFTNLDVELFNGLVEIFNVVNEESLVHTNGGNELFILAEDCIGDARFMSRSAFGRSKCVHVNKHALRFFRCNCKILFAMRVGKRVDLIRRFVQKLSLLIPKVKLFDGPTLCAYNITPNIPNTHES